MNLIKTSFYTSISTAVTFLSGFIVTKVVAVKIGPEGIAYLGQFQNSTAILAMLATGAISNGVVKYLAEHKNDEVYVRRILNTAFTIVFICSIIISLIVTTTSIYLSEIAFKSTEYWLVYLLYGLFILAVSTNMIFAATLNGLKLIKNFTIINICSSLIGLTITVSFSYFFGLIGVLISSTVLAGIMFFINLYIFKKKGIKWQPNLKEWDRKIGRQLFSFSLMTLVSGFINPSMQIAIRNKIIYDFSIQEAGYWQAVTKLSDYYLGFITTVLAVYYMPRLSEIKDQKEMKSEIINGYKLILPIVGLMAFLIWIFKNQIIQILFSPEFLPMLPLFKYQLIGDVLKIGSWLLAFLMLSKAMTKTYIVTEILFSCSFVAMSYWFLNHYGIVGVTYSFALNYGIYWIALWFIMRKYFNKMPIIS